MYGIEDMCLIDIKNKKKTNKVIGFEIGSLVVRDMKYYYGTDKLTSDVAVEIIQNRPRTWNSSFTGEIGKSICIDEIKKEFERIGGSLLNNMIGYSSNGAIIFSRKNQTFENVLCGDSNSAYPTILLEPVPYKFTHTTHMNLKDGKMYYGKIVIKGLKCKNQNFLPLYRGKAPIDENKVHCIGQRIAYANEYSYYGYINHEMRLLKYAYNYEDISFTDIYEVDFKLLPQKSIEAIKAMYDEKTAGKENKSANYYAIKQKFNRVFGYFMTSINENGVFKVRDDKVPYYIGCWIISAQRQKMLDGFKAIGIENIVAAHTDSILSVNVSEDVYKSLNSPLYKDLGWWDIEKYDAIEYFSNTRAKYLQNGEIGFKHGGISDHDLEVFKKRNTDFAAINRDTLLSYTIEQYFSEKEIGFCKIYKQVKVKFGSFEQEE